jgi:hypothetical protein
LPVAGLLPTFLRSRHLNPLPLGEGRVRESFLLSPLDSPRCSASTLYFLHSPLCEAPRWPAGESGGPNRRKLPRKMGIANPTRPASRRHGPSSTFLRSPPSPLNSLRSQPLTPNPKSEIQNRKSAPDPLQSAVARTGIKPTAKAKTGKKNAHRKADKARKPQSRP